MQGKPDDLNARVAAGLSVLLCWLTVGLLLATLLTHRPVNHIALDVRIFYVLAGLSFAAAIVGRLASGLSWGFFWIAVLSGAALLIMIFVLDHWNLVVGYEVWLARGQPGFGEVGP